MNDTDYRLKIERFCWEIIMAAIDIKRKTTKKKEEKKMRKEK